MWTWTHSGLDCHGNPEAGVVFIVTQTLRAIVGTGPDGAPVYAFLPDVTLTTRDTSAYEAFTPQLGEVAITTVTARDPAGNLDTDPCL